MQHAKFATIPFKAAPGIDIDLVKGCAKFKNWVESIDDSKFVIKGIELQSVDMFGPKQNIVGFVKFVADVVDLDGEPQHGIIFMRGGAVGMLVIINKKHVVVTVQPRLATGSFGFIELAAGMLDGSGNFAGVAAKEIEEELGLKIPADKLTDLGAVSGSSDGFFLSPGGCDETMRLFCIEIEISDDELAAMEGKCTGVIEEHEQIALKIIPYDELWKLPDAKSAVAYLYYEKLKEQQAKAAVPAVVAEAAPAVVAEAAPAVVAAPVASAEPAEPSESTKNI
ncbi:MAG: NUDIX domain-containing protein [Cyanobacteria bacterium REEB67]|nr:NUDIX domain-containing protein [Cyanobacteria bacterium REEB67]